MRAGSLGREETRWNAGIIREFNRYRDWIALEAGYRYLAVNYDKDGFLFDGSIRGPIVGASVRF